MSDKIFNKIIKKDYNNHLEEVLSKKNFSEEVKNILLSMFYKIENGYNDYATIKRETFDKKVYIEKLINIIEKDCEKIEFLPLKTTKKEVVDKNNKEIICKPIEINILYSIAKIQKRNIVIKFLDRSIEEAISNILNTGNNINIVEPLRDFNGFSWNIIVKDIEDLNCNLIYQNMIFLIGNEFIDKWVNNYEPLVDYFDLFQSSIEKNYGKDLKEKIITNLIQLSILINCKQNKEFKDTILKLKEEVLEEKIKFDNKAEYLVNIANEKKKKEKEIKRLDKIINDKNLLLEEYEERNKNLPLEKKIFSIRVLKNKLLEERKSLLKEINEINKKMNPKVFIESKNALEQKLKYININEGVNFEKEIYKKLINLQKCIIKCMYIKTKEIQDKNEFINMMYMYRYYNFLPLRKDKNICDIEELKVSLEKLTKSIIQKAIDMKIINQIANDSKLNYNITKEIIISKIITLEDINIKLVLENENVLLTVFDEEIEENKVVLENITKEDFKIKFNKKVKLFY